MSADDTVLVLGTKGPQYRVAHLRAAEHILRHDEKGQPTPDMCVQFAWHVFGKAEILTKADALLKAAELDAPLPGEVFGKSEHGIRVVEFLETEFPASEPPSDQPWAT